MTNLRKSEKAVAKPRRAAHATEAETALEPVSRQRGSDSEKLTINLGAVDLGSIDLLVAEGFFSNRSDLIRTAVRNLLASHRDIVNNALVRQDRSLGLRRITRGELEALRRDGRRLRISAVGLVVIDDDVTPALARDAIEALSVLGSLQASPAVRRVISDLSRPQGTDHQDT